MNFEKACIEVLKNDKKFTRKDNIGIRNNYGNIEFYYPSTNNVTSTQLIILKDLEDDWVEVNDELLLNVPYINSYGRYCLILEITRWNNKKNSPAYLVVTGECEFKDDCLTTITRKVIEANDFYKEWSIAK